MPRRHLLLATVVYALVCFLALVLSLPVLAIEAGGGRAATEVMRDSAPWPLLLLGLNAVLIVATALLGVFYIRGARIPGAAFIAVVLLPVVVGLVGCFRQLTTVLAALTMVSAPERTKLLGQGIAEACGPLAVAAAVSAILGGLVFVAATGERLTATSKLDKVTLIVGGATWLVAVGAHVALGSWSAITLLFWVLLAIAPVGAAAARSSLASEADKTTAWRRTALMCLSLVVVSLLAAIADERFRGTRLPSAPIACGFASPSRECQLEIVHAYAGSISHLKFAVAVDVLAVVVVHGLALFGSSALSVGVRSIRLSFALGAFMLIGGAIGVLALERHVSAAEENAVAFAARLDRTGVELPHASATNATSVEAGEGFLLVVGADGVLKCDPTETGQLVADTLKCVEAARSAAKKTGSGSLIGRSARDDAEDLLQRSLRRDEEAPGTRSKGEEGSMGARGYGVLPPPRSFPSHDLETGPFGMRPPIVAADKSAKALDVLRALDALAGVPLDVRAALSSPSQDAMADLYVGRPQQAIPFTIASRIASLATADEARGLGVFEPPPLTLGILVDGIDARVIAMSGRGGGAVTVSLDATLPSTRRQWEDAAQLDVRRLVIAPGATSDWQSAIDLVDAFNDPSSPLSQVCRRSHGCDVLLTADRGALEALANRPSATDLQAALSDAGIASQPSALSTVGHGTDAQEPSLHYGAPRVDGLPQGVAQSTIRMHSGSLRYCFEKRVNAAGPHAAKGTLSITVDSSGRTQSVTLSGIDDAELSSCITSVAKAWRFPMPTSGTATISQPLEFRR